MVYQHKKPHSLNLVSVTIFLVIGAIIYSGVKFGPVYMKVYKVDQALMEMRHSMSNVKLAEMPQRARRKEEGKLREKAIQALELIDLNYADLQVFFSDDYKVIHAVYTIIVKHPLGKTTTLHFHRKQELDGAG
ncbi:MAG: hypothetical protein V2A73_13160 [Pseudomonadota bacterium]